MDQKSRDAQRARYEELRVRSGKMKKRLLIVIAAVIGAIFLLVGVTALIGSMTDGRENPFPDVEGNEFYPTYQGDIMQNKGYLELDREVDYDNSYGLTQSINEENREEFDLTVLFLCDYLQTIIAGDANAYNACFNETYFKSVKPMGAFSPQMLYDMKIVYQSEEEGEKGARLITYRLEYMIYRNDGTFRRDVGSDAMRPQFVTLRVSADGSIAIERLLTQIIGNTA